MGQEYCVARTVEEAVSLLREKRGRVIAGGTDLMLDLRKGKKHSEMLVDITGIPELTGVSMEADHIRVGACCTFAQLERASAEAGCVPLRRATSGSATPRWIRKRS